MEEEKEVKIMWKALPFGIFKRGVLVFVGPAEELISLYRKEYPSDADAVEKVFREDILTEGLALGYTLKCCSDAIIWLPKPQPLEVLIHEFVHVIFWILELVEMKLCAETEELVAYMMEYMSENIIPWYQEHTGEEKCE